MTPGALLDSVEGLEVAWRRIRVDRKTDFVLGEFEYTIFNWARASLLPRLWSRIQEEGDDFQPEPLRVMRVPKGNRTTRPGAVPVLQDRIYFQYLVDEVADAVETQLIPIPDGVLHSYRYRGDREAAEMFYRREAGYGTFQKRTREMASNHRFIISTDVASFYERIYHHELENTLIGLGAPSVETARTMSLLRKWQKGRSYGIPQGIWPSDYLGNLYLDPVDKQVSRAGLAYCRYVDDLRIGANSEQEANRILLLLEERLAVLGLSLNGAKTQVIPADQVDAALFPYRERFEQIFAELRAIYSDFLEAEGLIEAEGDPYWEPSDEEIAAADLVIESETIRRLFRELLSLGEPDVASLRFCLKKFKAFSDADVLNDVLNNLPALARVVQRVVPYLVHMSRNLAHKSRIRRVVSRYIVRGEAHYDWENMWYLHCLSRVGTLDSATVGRIREVLVRDRGGLEEAVAVQAFLLVGRHGDDADRRWIQEQFESEHSPWVRRSLLVAIQDLPESRRNHFYGYCRGLDSLTDATIDYCLQA